MAKRKHEQDDDAPHHQLAAAIDQLEAGRGDKVNWDQLSADFELQEDCGEWVTCYRFLKNPRQLEDFKIRWNRRSPLLYELFDEARIKRLRAGDPPTDLELDEYRRLVAYERHGWRDADERLDEGDCYAVHLYELVDDRDRTVFLLEVEEVVEEGFFGNATRTKSRGAMGFKTRTAAEAWLTENGEWTGGF